MEIHGLGTLHDKIVPDNWNWKYPKYPTIHLAHLPKSANFLGYFWKKSLITCPLSMHFTIPFQYISRLSSTLSSLSFGTWKCKQLIDQNLTPVSSAVCLRVCVGMHHSSLFFNQLPYIPILNWVCFIRITHNLSSPYATMNWNAYSDSEIAFDIWSLKSAHLH